MPFLILILAVFFSIMGIAYAGVMLVYLVFCLPALVGAPFVPTPLKVVQKMIKLAEPKPGETIYDLGSGDGRIVIEAVKNANVRAVGIEVNPILVYLSRRKIKKLGLQEKAEIRWGNIFKTDLSSADIIFTYLLQPTNNLLEKRLLSKTKPGTRIVSLSFVFHKIPFVKSDPEHPSIRLYQTPGR